MSEFSNSDLLQSEVCISTNSNSFEDDMSYEVQQAYRIFTGFLLDKHKGITSPFLQPIGHHEGESRGVQGRVQSQLRQSVCLRRIEEKFINKEYETITEFVADFRLMLENCYRYHGVDHWISKQGQKLEIMLEQKLTLLSRTLREKTTLAVTSKGRFGIEEERSPWGTSTRRRLAPRSLTTITVGGHESVMVQTLRTEEQQRAKEEKRQRELEKKEAEEMSAKELEEWEQGLLSQASPHTVDTLWELPAIGHFLCLAQTALSLPEIVFFELERCLLMPRCSQLLSKIMSSLLSPPQRRATMQRRPALPYRRWESELRQRVMGWYRAVGASHDQPRRSEQLGLCHQFFRILGEVSPLEDKPFHLLPFYQRVWIVKGLCDHVYETQKDVQDAVLAQPIHECRESILGYDSKENAYIHFPHFCGADLRIYCQSPSTPPSFPFPSILVKRVETEQGTEGENMKGIKNEGVKNNSVYDGASMGTRESEDLGNKTTGTLGVFKEENAAEDKKRFHLWSLMTEESSESSSSDGDSCKDSKADLKTHSNFLSLTHNSLLGGGGVNINVKKEISDEEPESQNDWGFLLGWERAIKPETKDPCLNVGEHSYTGRSPAHSGNLGFPVQPLGLKTEEARPSQGNQPFSCLECFGSKTSNVKSAGQACCCGRAGQAAKSSLQSAQNPSEERANNKIWTKKRKWKKKHRREQPLRVKKERERLQHGDRMRLSPSEAARSAVLKVATTIKKEEKKKKHKTGKKPESSKKIKDESPTEPSFKLVCTSLGELRELISKIEDELDDLESTKKRLGRWYCRREAVKELHSTLIRLLNELLPWEPKLVKAYQRNRLRLKKEFDDFKKHPEYNNFVREECVSSSSDDDYGEEEMELDADHCGGLEEEDQEHIVPRGLWSGANTRDLNAESAAEKTVTYVPANHLKHGAESTTSTFADLRGESTSELSPTKQSKDLAWAARMPAHTSASPTSPVPYPNSGLPKGYTPIPTLLAKSVGNKVTLMKRPTDFPVVSSADGGSLALSHSSAVTMSKVSKAHCSPSSSQPNLQQMTTQRPQQMQVFGYPGMAAEITQAKPSQTEPKNPIQVMYKVPEGLSHLIRKDGSSPVNISALDQNTSEKATQQVVILPSNLLIQKTEAKVSSSNPQHSKGIQLAVSKGPSPVCISTDVPGFSIPENKIPVHQVAPLKDTTTGRTSFISPHLLQEGINTIGSKGANVCSVLASTPQGSTSSASTITTLSSAVSAENVKSADPGQELKTVCIRDSQSILVRTRGGNTGIVKVQTSSDQNALGAFPSCPVITISPQFKAFLVSKTSTTLSPSAPSQTSPSTVTTATSISVKLPQKQSPLVLTAPSSNTNSVLTTATSSTPVTSIQPRNETKSTANALSRGSNTSSASTVETKLSQLPQKNPIGFPVPVSSSSGVPQVLPQQFVTKAGVKRTNPEERSQVTKYILVTPSSSSPSASNVAISKGTNLSTNSSPSSRVVFIGQPTAPSCTNFMGSIPQQMTSSLSSQTLKTASSPSQSIPSVTSEALSKANNISLPSGVQVQLSGKTTTIGQNIGTVSQSPLKGVPVSYSGTCCPTATTTTIGLVPAMSLITVKSSSSQLGTCSSPTTSSSLRGIPSISVSSQLSCSTSTSTAVTMPAGNINKKDLGRPASVLSNSSHAQMTTTVGSSAAQTPSPNPAQFDRGPLYIKSGISEEKTPFLLPSQHTRNKIQTPFTSTPTTCTTFTTSTSGPVQQRIIINTSTPLAAGTQILLNDARFVVPPQGLGPGSHVLIISSPAQVPTASSASTGAYVPSKEASHASLSPQTPILRQSAARLPGVPVVNSFTACTPATGPSLPASTQVAPFRLAGTPDLSSAAPTKTNVISACLRLSSAQASHFASPAVSTSSLLSSTLSLGSGPALVSPVVTSASALGSVKVTAGTAGPATQAECSLTKSPALASPLPAQLSSLPLSPCLSAGAPCSPIIPVPAPLSSAPASMAIGHQQVIAVAAFGSTSQLQHTAVSPAAPSPVDPQGIVDTGLTNASIKNKKSVMPPVVVGTQRPILPGVAVPPIVSAVSRMQTLPIATVPPIGSTVSTFETVPVAGPPPSSTTVITPTQLITSLTTKKPTHPPAIWTNQALGKPSVQTSALGKHTSVTSELLISPDGAVLSTVKCQLSPAEMIACPKPLDALVVSSNSSTGALQTHDSTSRPPQSDTK
ncbi:putative bromodomain-containing protein 10 [Xenentodon cancila]